MINEARHYFNNSLTNPDEAEVYPELTERNRLMGSLPAERKCYNVSHYDLNLEIDMDQKTIAGYNTITALAVNNFTKLQV